MEYEKQEEKINEIKPKTRRSEVCTEINIFRNSYQRELMKVKDSNNQVEECEECFSRL